MIGIYKKEEKKKKSTKSKQNKGKERIFSSVIETFKQIIDKQKTSILMVSALLFHKFY